jgi:hypothetical protein
VHLNLYILRSIQRDVATLFIELSNFESQLIWLRVIKRYVFLDRPHSNSSRVGEIRTVNVSFYRRIYSSSFLRAAGRSVRIKVRILQRFRCSLFAKHQSKSTVVSSTREFECFYSNEHTNMSYRSISSASLLRRHS